MVLSSNHEPVLLAQVEKPLGSLEGLGPLGTVGANLEGALRLFFDILSAVVGIMTISAAIWFIFQFFIGAIQIVSSGGDKTKIQEAASRITSAVAGIVIIIAAIFLISLIGRMIGLNILGPWEFITDLWSE